MTRLWLSDELPCNSESRAIGVVLRALRRDTALKFLVSHADPAQGRVGTIYQAGGWLYTGLSEAMPLYDIGDGVARHSCSLSHAYGTHSVAHFRRHGVDVMLVPQAKKHRYVYFLDPTWRERLRYPFCPIPRGRIAVKVALYARVSTSDRDQNPETQLLALRDFVRAQRWESFREYVDKASATDLVHRTAWRDLLTDASRKRFDLLLVWRMDRAFRSVLDAATTLEWLRTWGVGLRSYTEPWLDTTSPFGEALYYITVAYAQLERGILRERVKAGMERARREGRRIGRPKVTDRRGFLPRLQNVLERLHAGAVSRRRAAKELGIGYATLKRLLDGKGTIPPSEAAT